MLMLMLVLVLSIGYLCDSHVCCSNASWYYASACASPCAAVLGRMHLLFTCTRALRWDAHLSALQRLQREIEQTISEQRCRMAFM
jgi:hypothetical protein